MIDQKQIPPEVVEAALRAYSGNSCECSSCRKAVIRTIAAALAAWPGMYTDQMAHEAQPKRLILPLPQEARDGE
jgi:hypothetical protein